MLHYFRIAVTALSLTACVLLIALWVRSYYFLDSFGGPPQLFTSWRGQLFTGGGVHQAPLPDEEVPSDSNLHLVLGAFVLTTIDENNISYDGGYSIPVGALVFLMGIVAAAPWLRWRFSIRTLLIATTLVAVVLGIIVAAM